MAREAAYYKHNSQGDIVCQLCSHFCIVPLGGGGVCRARRNDAGSLLAAGYGQVASLAVDPIEKKPLYHFHPGSKIFSVGGVGCNLRCRFCQNHQLAHGAPETKYFTPTQLINFTLEQAPESIGIAFTYNEPLINFEYLLDIAVAAKEKSLKTVLVSNGFINAQPWAELIPLIDAVNIDLKAFTDEFYRRLTGGRLKDVKRNIVQACTQGCHVEVTTLLVTGENDHRQEIGRLAQWLAAETGKSTPLHLSRFFPAYKLSDSEPTPLETMRRAYHAAREALHHVYLGNAPELDKTDTSCPRCGALNLSRRWGRVTMENIRGTACSCCGKELNIIT